jgi:predicted nucleic acid-binding protein
LSDITVIDTDLLIDAGRGESRAKACLDSLEDVSALAVSVVTQMEMLIGCRNKTEQENLEKIFLRFIILRVTEETSDLAVDLLRTYRLSHGLLIADALIAATAMAADVPFISKNQRDYRFIAGLRLLPYP